MTQLKVLQVVYATCPSDSSVRGLHHNSVNTREESGSLPAWARISRRTRFVSIECITRSILLCVSMCLKKQAGHLHCHGLLELRLEKKNQHQLKRIMGEVKGKLVN